MEKNQKRYAYVLVGLPGLGKSTFVQSLLETNKEFFIYSTDNYIDQKAKEQNSTYEEMYPVYSDEALKAMNEALDQAIKENKNLIFDRTNLTLKARRKILSRLPKEYHKVAYCIKYPTDEKLCDEWNERLNSRAGKHIPQMVIDDMKLMFIEPSFDEGFDEICIKEFI